MNNKSKKYTQKGGNHLTLDPIISQKLFDNLKTIKLLQTFSFVKKRADKKLCKRDIASECAEPQLDATKIPDEEMDNLKDWVGATIEDIYRGHGPWDFEIPFVHPSKHHTVLYEGVPTLQSAPKPRKSVQLRHWEENFVRLPYSSKNLYPTKSSNGEEVLVERWTLIKEALTKRPITTSGELEAAIHSYNSRLPKFNALHFYFNEVLEDYEAEAFFKTVLPGIIQLALQMPNVITASIPLLKRECNKAITLSQMQISCIMANAFLCTFPWRRDMASYPGVNFVRLYSAHLSDDTKFNPVSEKLKCICHYFRKILQKPRTGAITFKRKYLPRTQMPRWDRLENTFANTKVRISSTGTIEDNGEGLLQVDFANKFVGGGVLGFGCVQEEIRFVINPELIVSRLFTEQLGHTEALVIIGSERFSNYSGYADTFTWNGNCDDETPYDASGRKQTTIVAIDAQYFTQTSAQFDMGSVLREVNKAYIGFQSNRQYPLPAVATGNWGCGAFRGNPHLKFLVQLMACLASKRDMVYFTFGDDKLKDTLFSMYVFLVNNEITCAQLWKLISRFQISKVPADQFYPFLQQAYFDSRNQMSIKQCFSWFKKSSKDEASTSGCTKTDSKNLQSTTSGDFVIDMVESDSMDIENAMHQESSTSISSLCSVKAAPKKFKQTDANDDSREGQRSKDDRNPFKTNTGERSPFKTSPNERSPNKRSPNERSPFKTSPSEVSPNKRSPKESRKHNESRLDGRSVSELMQTSDEKLLGIIHAIDGETFTKTESNFNQSLLSSVDQVAEALRENTEKIRRKSLERKKEIDENLNQSMDVDEIMEFLGTGNESHNKDKECEVVAAPKRKITDYFSREKK